MVFFQPGDNDDTLLRCPIKDIHHILLPESAIYRLHDVDDSLALGDQVLRDSQLEDDLLAACLVRFIEKYRSNFAD